MSLRTFWEHLGSFRGFPHTHRTLALPTPTLRPHRKGRAGRPNAERPVLGAAASREACAVLPRPRVRRACAGVRAQRDAVAPRRRVSLAETIRQRGWVREPVSKLKMEKDHLPAGTPRPARRFAWELSLWRCRQQHQRPRARRTDWFLVARVGSHPSLGNGGETTGRFCPHPKDEKTRGDAGVCRVLSREAAS